MGKGTIISHIADGQYNVTVNYNSAGITAQLAALNTRETQLNALIAAETDETKKNLLKVQLLSVQKRIEYLSDTSNVPVDNNITAWCADFTEDLTGEVGLIEIGREQANGVNIQPGYDANAVYDDTRDGHLTPLMAQTAAASFYNLAMLPGTQKWKPTYLYGTITAIDETANSCTVLLDSITSSQQTLNIVSTAYSIADVPIDYMDCDASAFDVGDEVIVKYTGYDPAVPKVIGFKENPIACCWIEPFTGPAVTTKYPWITQQYPVTPAPYTVSISSGKIQFHLPAQSTSGERDAQIYYDADSTPGGGLVREGATRSRIVCPTLTAVCNSFGAVAMPVILSRMGVLIEAEHHVSKVAYHFWNMFFSVTPMIPVGGGVPDNHYCWASPVNYTTEYIAGTIMHMTQSNAYFSYLEVGADKGIWLDFPAAMDIKGVYVFSYVLPVTSFLPPPVTYGNAQEHLFEIDSIEIC